MKSDYYRNCRVLELIVETMQEKSIHIFEIKFSYIILSYFPQICVFR